jgi:hypothetical protein
MPLPRHGGTLYAAKVDAVRQRRPRILDQDGRVWGWGLSDDGVAITKSTKSTLIGTGGA